MNEFTHLDLCSGTGAFSIGFEREGFTTIGFSEIDPYCCKLLAQNWPSVPNLGDLKEIDKETIDGLVNSWHDSEMSCIKSSKYENAASLYHGGLSIQDCADYYGITRQAMHKILIRRGATFRPHLKFGNENHFYRGGVRMDKRAQRLAESAISKGILQPEPCEVCGSASVHAHHDDYNNPLEVRWLCQPHHHEWHKHNKAIELRREGRSSAGRICVVTAGDP